MRGGAYIGALQALLEVQGSLEFPDGIYGCSIGSVAASLVAFNIPYEKLRSVLGSYHKRSMWLTTPSVTQVFGISQKKGLLTMDTLRKSLVSLFTECGIESIETKKISDAPQPLFIVASNMTTRRPTILTGKVPLLQAILCSCCIPGIFEPQILYGDVYLDAGIYVRQVGHIVSPETLVLQLSPVVSKITPKSSLTEILYACYYGKETVSPTKNICQYKDLNVGVIDDVTDEQREQLIEKGYSQTLAFLTKMGAKER